jgi:hypothetical protein
MPSPYAGMPPSAFWKNAVAACEPPFSGIYRKKLEIGAMDGIATAGSCFAQHIAKHLSGSGYRVLDFERAPHGLAGEAAARFGYNLYSARYGNIYSIRQLLQLVEESRGRFKPQDWIWERDGRFFDALRPSVEPHGLESPDEVVAHRTAHLRAVRRLFKATDILIFTFGLTEAWTHEASGTVYATAPETIAGRYLPEVHAFKNFTHAEILQDFIRLRAILQAEKPALRFIVTVSPVPLTATAGGSHVLSATIYSKSVLRAVAGELEATFPDVDYFPSYEMIASHPSRAAYYDDNLRTVRQEGVLAVMAAFLEQHPPVRQVARPGRSPAPRRDVCEDELLEAFS